MARFFKITLLFLIFLAGDAFGQNISAIRKKVSAINLTKNYEVKILENNFLSEIRNESYDNGQELRGYFLKNDLQKMTYTVGLSAWNIVTDFYYSKGDLIFIHQKKYLTVDENGFRDDQLKLGELRYYISNGNLFKTKKQGSVDFENFNNAYETATELKSYLLAN